MKDKIIADFRDAETAEEVVFANPMHFDRDVDIEEFNHLLRLLEARWKYPGDPEFAHGITKAEMHTDGFIFTARATNISNINQILARQMIRKLRPLYPQGFDFRWVISAASSGIDIGNEVARQAGLGIYHSHVEKDKQGKLTVWRHNVLPGQKVLIANELITTAGGSVLETKRAVAKENPQPVVFEDYTLLLINRMLDRIPEELSDGTKIISAYRYTDINEYKPEDCPMCKAGSVAMKPKGENWEKYFVPAIKLSA